MNICQYHCGIDVQQVLPSLGGWSHFLRCPLAEVLEHKHDGTWQRPSSHSLTCGHSPLGGSSVPFSPQGHAALEWVSGPCNAEQESLLALACTRAWSTRSTWSSGFLHPGHGDKGWAASRWAFIIHPRLWTLLPYTWFVRRKNHD